MLVDELLGVLVDELIGVLGNEVLGALLQCDRVQLGQQHGVSQLGQHMECHN